jgi:DNA-binding response OmpR family regulator
MVKVLLVDDEEEFVTALAERLEFRGFAPRVALDGEQALRLLDEWDAELMVLDLRMPGLGGCEVLRRAKLAHPHVQVIMLSGHGSEKDERISRERGAFDYLRKPVDIGDLVAILNKARQAAGQQPA